MTQPHVIAEWWIGAAGGRSVTDDGRSTEVLAFSTEQVVGWDPDIFIVASRPHREKLAAHGILGQMRSVREGRCSCFRPAPIPGETALRNSR